MNMTIDFSPKRWQQVKDTYRRWWAGELERPLIPVVLKGRDPERSQPAAPLLSQANCTDFSWSPEELIDRIDYELSCQVYLGDAYPYFNMHCFGPGVAAAFLGARLDNSSGRVWFHAPDDRPIQEIHFEYDAENIWLQRIKAIYKAGMERWQGRVLMGMTDLGGALDVLSTFRPSERLLLDLCDEPDEVERLLWEGHTLWHRYYDELNAVLQPVNPGYSDWSTLYSETPSYILQCDFAYMIGPKMFRQFVLPELTASCRRLPHAFYHLDGIGQIRHLETLVQIEELDGIQWIHGDGKPDSGNWPAVFQAIAQGRKRIQACTGGFPALAKIQEQLGTLKGLHYLGFLWSDYSVDDETWLRAGLMQYGID
jgi:5-methyltetrahydrofolate--homocysteine methyltransferase